MFNQNEKKQKKNKVCIVNLATDVNTSNAGESSGTGSSEACEAVV